MGQDGTTIWLGGYRGRGRPTWEYFREMRVHLVPLDFTDGSVPSGMRRSLAGVEEEETRCAKEGRGPGAAKLHRRGGELRPHGRVAAPPVMKKRSGVSTGMATDAEEEGGEALVAAEGRDPVARRAVGQGAVHGGGGTRVLREWRRRSLAPRTSGDARVGRGRRWWGEIRSLPAAGEALRAGRASARRQELRWGLRG